jgi:hypothetical protein
VAAGREGLSSPNKKKPRTLRGFFYGPTDELLLFLRRRGLLLCWSCFLLCWHDQFTSDPLFSLYDYCSPLPGKLFVLKIFLGHVTQKFKSKITQANEIYCGDVRFYHDENAEMHTGRRIQRCGTDSVHFDSMVRFFYFFPRRTNFSNWSVAECV